MSSPKIRADRLLFAQGFAASTGEAAALILSGRVLVIDGEGRERRVEKAGEALSPEARFRLKGEARAYVSRAGRKLEAALDAFQLDPAGWVCLDLGLSTGGFTDCLLQRGAARVHGVDVAYGIVDWRLRNDPRLVLHERTNARHLRLEHLGERVSLAVIDLSFIGLRRIWPVLPPLLEPDGHVVALVKPQFEVSADALERGVVRDDASRSGALARAKVSAREAGLEPLRSVEAPVPGRDGNREILLHLRPGVHTFGFSGNGRGRNGVS